MQVLLSCKHSIEFIPPPKKGDYVYCRWCTEYRIVEGAAELYRMRCATCHKTWNYGADRSAAYRACIRHLKKWQNHLTRVTNNGVIEQEITEKTEPIPGVLTKSQQWQHDHPEHQKSLRALW